MKKPGEDRFELRPRPPRAKQGVRGQRFVSRVIGAVCKAGGGPASVLARRVSRPRAKRGRGQVAASFAGAGLGPRSRRVIIKLRLVVIKSAGPRSVQMHLRYIVREGVSRDGESAQPYDATRDTADLKAFEEKSAGDRHQFRFIIAPEDGTQLADLQAYTRELMARVERNLGTSLEWVAVDHWDTDNPHTHLVVRGKDAAGRDLIIARDYIRHGMRRRACELATEWLGPRTDQEFRDAGRREISRERWTGLDRELKSRAHDGVIRLAGEDGSDLGLEQRARLLGRLAQLQAMGLAQPVEADVWRWRADAEDVLRAMGERGDIVRTLQRAMGKDVREPVVFDPARNTPPVIGRIAAKGLADELKEDGFVVIDALDGRAHYVRLPSSTDLADLPVGGIAEVRSTGERIADRNILNAAASGVYHTDIHRAQLRALPRHREDAEDIVASHVRRLEALRRVGAAERLAEGIWRVPDDLIARGKVYDRRHLGAARIAVLSYLSLDQQVRAVGATWLDRQLVDQTEVQWPAHGFAVSARSALQARATFLVEHKLAELLGGCLIPAQGFIATLRARELEAVARKLAVETGLTHRPIKQGASASGVYRRSLALASGRFAMLDDGLGFSLVPWHPVIEKRLGQSMTAIIGDDHVTWHFGRQRGR